MTNLQPYTTRLVDPTPQLFVTPKTYTVTKCHTEIITTNFYKCNVKTVINS